VSCAVPPLIQVNAWRGCLPESDFKRCLENSSQDSDSSMHPYLKYLAKISDAAIAFFKYWYFKTVFENYPNLQNIIAALKSIQYKNTNGYDGVLDVLAHGYNPNSVYSSLESLFNSKLQANKVYEKTFLVRTVHILWMEMNGQLPWSIKNYSNNEINSLFYDPTFSWLNPQLKPMTGSSLDSIAGNEFEDYEPQISLEASYKLHALALKLKANTIADSTDNASRWIKSNFFHAYKDAQNDWGFDKYTGKKPYTWMPYGNNAFPANLEELFNQRIIGCREPALLHAEILRSLNIPAVVVHPGGHAVVDCPTINKFMHGDYLATRPVTPLAMEYMSTNEFDSYMNDYDYNKRLDTKLSQNYDAWHVMLMSTSIQRSNNELYLGFNVSNESNADFPALIKDEVPQYNVTYNASTHVLDSQKIPIRSLSELSAPGANVWQ
jgi:hypothetical protein